VVVPPLLFRAIQSALTAAEFTYSAYDPTVLGALEAAGYSQSFDLGPTERRQPVPAGRWRAVEIEPSISAVRLPPGVRLDLGGIGKGLAVDGAMARMAHLPRALVNAGGDLGLKTAPGAGPVIVEVANPWNTSETLCSFGLYRGAVATSSTLGRRWGQGLHHIIDPRTGEPSRSGVVAATVVGTSVAKAEVLAKACIVLGPERGMRLLAEQEHHGLLVLESGGVLYTPKMEGYLYERT